MEKLLQTKPNGKYYNVKSVVSFNNALIFENADKLNKQKWL